MAGPGQEETLARTRPSVRFTTVEAVVTLCVALRESFDYFGGVPTEVLLDNAKSVVIAQEFP